MDHGGRCHSFEAGGSNKQGPALWGVMGRAVHLHRVGGERFHDELARHVSLIQIGRYLQNGQSFDQFSWQPKSAFFRQIESNGYMKQIA